MALVKCVECGHTVSTGAAACPGCGSVVFMAHVNPNANVQRKAKAQAMAITAAVVALFFALLFLLLGGPSQEQKAKIAAAVEASKTPEQKAADAAAAAEKARREIDFQFSVVAVKALKERLKSPASFELVSAVLVDGGGALCVEYRGTNSFNAVITEHAVIKRDFKLGKWNSDCAGKSVTDMTSIRHAM